MSERGPRYLFDLIRLPSIVAFWLRNRHGFDYQCRVPQQKEETQQQGRYRYPAGSSNSHGHRGP